MHSAGKFKAGEGKLCGEERSVESEVVSDEHGVSDVLKDVPDHLGEARCPDDIAGGDAVDVGGADVSARVN